MPQPTLGQVHVNRPLTAISQMYVQQPEDLVADRIFPVVPVQKQSDRYFVYKKGDWFRNEAQIRAGGTESAGGGYGLDNTPTYYAPVYSFHQDVDEQVRANSDDPLNADQDATMFVTQRLLLSREVQVINAVFVSSTWTGSTTGSDITPGTAWDLANSTPLVDIEAQIWSVKQNTGRFPNRLILGAHVWTALKNHDSIIQRVKYTASPGTAVTTDIVAALLAPPGVNDFQVIVASAIINNGVEGGSDSFAYIAPLKNAVLAYVPKQAGIRLPTSGYIFTWTGLLGAGAFGTRISTIPMPWLGQGTVRIEGDLAFTVKIVGADLGVYFLNATST